MKLRLLLWVVFWLLSLQGNTQRMLLLEIRNEVKSIKFGEGSEITFKTKDNPDEWQTRVIKNIDADQGIIVFEDGMVYVSEISRFRTINRTAWAASRMFSVFGGVWLLYGTVAIAAGQDSVKPGHLIIGGVALGIGWLFNKFAVKRTYRIGENAHLRLLNIDFSPPPAKRGVLP